MLKNDHLVRVITCAVAVSCGAIMFNACSDSSSSGAGGATSSSGSTTQSSATGSSASGTMSSSASTSTATGSTTASSSSGGMQNVERCFPFDPEGGACAPVATAEQQFGPCTTMHEHITMWDSGPNQTATECCYQVDVVPNDPACP